MKTAESPLPPARGLARLRFLGHDYRVQTYAVLLAAGLGLGGMLLMARKQEKTALESNIMRDIGPWLERTRTTVWTRGCTRDLSPYTIAPAMNVLDSLIRDTRELEIARVSELRRVFGTRGPETYSRFVQSIQNIQNEYVSMSVDMANMAGDTASLKAASRARADSLSARMTKFGEANQAFVTLLSTHHNDPQTVVSISLNWCGGGT